MGLFTGLGVVQIKTCIQLGCLQEHEFLGVCMCLQILMITPIRIHNSIFIGELFQIEVSDGLVHPLGSRQNVNLYPAVVITGAQVFRSLYAFRVKKDQMN